MSKEGKNRAGAGDRPDEVRVGDVTVSVLRSAQREKTVSLEMIDGRYVMRVPSTLSGAEVRRLAAYTAEERYRAAAAPLIEGLAGPMTQHPTAFGRLLCALDLYVNGSTEIAVVGDPATPATQALLATVARAYLPRAVRALLDPAAPDDLPALIPLLVGRDLVDGQPAAYVCRQFACRLPVTTPAALAAELETHDA